MNTRNFLITAHIDHGKSTLADRFLELTGTVDKRKMQPQYLDMMDLERERGITIKMQPVRMEYKEYVLNLIDTPGHVDFSYEVSRSLAAVEGAILLVDATQGIQAQTLANLDLAKKQNLVIIPVVNKIDMPQAKTEETTEDLAKLLNVDRGEVLKISAKYNTNVAQVLGAVITKVPSPKGDEKKPLRALIFDSEYDHYKGVVAYVRVVDGEIGRGERILLMKTQTEGEVKELGYFKPEFSSQEKLSAGEIGYIATGIKEPGKVRVGDTIVISNVKCRMSNVEPLPGYQESKPVVFASFYLENPDDYDLLKEALAELKLSDASLTFEPEFKEALGRGFRCGFLGSLHAEIISERLRREFNLNLVISSPSVIYKIGDKKGKGCFIYSVSGWPDESKIESIEEPYAKLELITPTVYLGRILEILENLGGKHLSTRTFGTDRLLLIYEAPLREVIVGLYDKIKGATQGYASMNYEILDYRPADLIKLDVLIHGRKEEAFSKIVPRERAYQEGSAAVKKLKELLPAQLFSVALQAAVGGKIIARETIRAKGKDVIAPLYGGDYTRKRKLLEIQKKGKQELKEKGRVRIPAKVFLEMFKK